MLDICLKEIKIDITSKQDDNYSDSESSNDKDSDDDSVCYECINHNNGNIFLKNFVNWMYFDKQKCNKISFIESILNWNKNIDKLNVNTKNIIQILTNTEKSGNIGMNESKNKENIDGTNTIDGLNEFLDKYFLQNVNYPCLIKTHHSITGNRRIMVSSKYQTRILLFGIDKQNSKKIIVILINKLTSSYK